jgi:hypothetical protein
LVLADSVVVQKEIEILLNFNPGYVNANTKTTKFGLSPLALICYGGTWGAESIAALLKWNADVTERDSRGGTCLHLCLYSDWGIGVETFGPSSWIEEYSAGIILLIKHGIDVYAEDHDGLSASDIADATPFYGDEDLGSAQGDVWDFALAACGYNISTFRQGRPRKARYREFYHREDFEKLWEGQEHLCPYYYHEQHSVSDEDSEACSDEDGGKGWVTTDSEYEGSDVVDLEGNAD